PRGLAIALDLRTAIVVSGVGIVVGGVFGAVAAYRPEPRLLDSLAGAARSTAGASVGRVRNVLVVAQVALAVVLLSAAGLMLNSVARLARVSPGFIADHLLTFKVTLTGERYATAEARRGAAMSLLERVGALAGVRSAAIISVVPFGGMRNATVVQIEGRT